MVIGHPLIRSLIRWNCSLFTCSLSSSALLRSLVRSLVYDKPRAHEIFHSCTIHTAQAFFRRCILTMPRPSAPPPPSPPWGARSVHRGFGGSHRSAALSPWRTLHPKACAKRRTSTPSSPLWRRPDTRQGRHPSQMRSGIRLREKREANHFFLHFFHFQFNLLFYLLSEFLSLLWLFFFVLVILLSSFL